MFKKQKPKHAKVEDKKNEKIINKEPIKIKETTNKNTQNVNINIRKNIERQASQDRNISTKAKITPTSPKKGQKIDSNNTNNNKNYNTNIQNENKEIKNINAEYSEIVEKKLRDSSLSKSQFNHKKEKKNDFLKSSININAESEFDAFMDNNKINTNMTKKENIIINNFVNPLANFKNEATKIT